MSDSWIDWNPQIDEPSKSQAVVKHALVKGQAGIIEVLHDARQVTEPDVDIFDLLVLGSLKIVRASFRLEMLLLLYPQPTLWSRPASVNPVLRRRY